jgi:hypothetical protein
MTQKDALTLEAEQLKVPDKVSLGNLAKDLDGALGAVTKVLDFVTKYGSFVPGASAVIGPLTLLDKTLNIVKSLLDHTGA